MKSSQTGRAPELWRADTGERTAISYRIEQGRTIKLVSIASPGRAFKLKVAEMRAPHHMVWSSGMPLGLFTGRRTYSITERGGAACDFRMTEAFSGPLAGPIGTTIPDLTESFDLFADGLTAAAEAAATT